jgi:hypothetical protein
MEARIRVNHVIGGTKILTIEDDIEVLASIELTRRQTIQLIRELLMYLEEE